MKAVAVRHRRPAYDNKHLVTSFLGMSTLMTLNDLEPPKQWFLVTFLW